MTEPAVSTTLHRVDPTQNMQRFYETSVQPNLFGGASLVRNWGRVGSPGILRADLYENEFQALEAQLALMKAKRSRGYGHLGTSNPLSTSK